MATTTVPTDPRPHLLEVETLAAPASAALELDVNIVETELDIGDTEKTHFHQQQQVLTDIDRNFVCKKDVHYIVVPGAHFANAGSHYGCG